MYIRRFSRELYFFRCSWKKLSLDIRLEVWVLTRSRSGMYRLIALNDFPIWYSVIVNSNNAENPQAITYAIPFFSPASFLVIIFPTYMQSQNWLVPAYS